MIDLSAVPMPVWLAIALAVAFLVGAGSTLVCLALIVGWWTSRRPKREEPEPTELVEAQPDMKIVPAWSDRDDVPQEAIPPAFRAALERETTQLCPPLEQADSAGWRFRPFSPTRHIADLAPTGEWKVVGGVDQLDIAEPEPPTQMPGFEVEPKARDRFNGGDKDLAAVVAKVRGKRKPAKAKVAVDLEAGTVTVPA